uniref:DNA-binding protein n=1 Tax=Rahnella sp. ChDrAdgB13 TaxID=1850581 RepID=UPI00244E53AF
MFIVAKELLGVVGLPATVKGIREALCRLSAGTPEWVRKREGTKAFEYHVDCLPEEARKVVQARAAQRVLAESRASAP